MPDHPSYFLSCISSIHPRSPFGVARSLLLMLLLSCGSFESRADYPASFQYWHPAGYPTLLVPPSGNTAITWWHSNWPGHNDMYLVPAACAANVSGLTVTCPVTGCRGTMICQAQYACADGATPVAGMCPEDDPEKQEPCCPALGNPVNIATGEKAQIETDYRGSGPMPLEFTRTYASNRLNPPNSRMGKRWRNNFEVQIHIRSTTPDFVTIYRSNGQRLQFSRINGAWVPDADITLRLQELLNTAAQRIGWKVTTNDNMVETYNALGKLTTLSNAQGLSSTFVYNLSSANGGDSNPETLDHVIDPFGRTLAFTYNQTGFITSLTDPAGSVITYQYDSAWNLISVTYPDETPEDSADNPQRIYHYEDSAFPHALTGITDENGSRFATWTYDAEGRAISSEHAGSAERIELAYNTDGTTTVIDASGSVQTYHFDRILGVAKITQIDGSPCATCGDQFEETSYDANGFAASRTDFNGNVTNLANDARGLLQSRTEAAGTPQQRTLVFEWHPQLRLPTKVTEPGKITNFAYDSVGRLITVEEEDQANSASRTTTTTYNAAGLVSTLNGPRTDVTDLTSYTYDVLGNLLTITDPLGHETQFTAYNAHGQPLSIVDANGTIRTLTYDARMRLASETVDGKTTTFGYDGVGNITQTTLPNGAFLLYSYDAAHRLTGIEDNLGNTTTYTLDAIGNIVQEDMRDDTGALAQTLSRSYDTLSRLVQSTSGTGQVTGFSYDANGNLVQSTLDPGGLNQQTAYAFDALNRVATITDAANGLTHYSYDARNNLTTVTDPRGVTTSYSYDGLDNQVQIDSPDTGVTTFTHDAAGNVLIRTDARSVVTEYAYDALNRVTQVHYPASPAENIDYEYDQPSGGFGVGHLTAQTDQSGSRQWTYDRSGNVVEESVTIQGQSYLTRYEYDAADVLVKTIYPSGRVVVHGLDATGRTVALDTSRSAQAAPVAVASNGAYLPFGPLRSFRQGNQVQTEFQFDLDYRLTSLVTGVAGGPAVLDLDYNHDLAGNVLGIGNGVSAGSSQSFAYDVLNRLITAAGAYGTQSFDYDPVGNRTAAEYTVNGVPLLQNYSYDQTSNRLLNIDDGSATRSVQYDAAGNLVQDERSDQSGLTLEYNNQNRLRAVAPLEAQP